MAPLLAGLLLLRFYRDVDPAGWVFEIDPAGGWRCRRPRSGQYLRGELHSLGQFPALLWLELRAPGGLPGGAACDPVAGDCADRPGGRPGRTRPQRRRRSPRQWLVCSDALADDDWRRLRRALRLQAGAAQPPNR